MASRIDELLTKINEDGVRKAEEKAHEIEEAALNKKTEIISQAREEADRIVKTAEEEANKFQSNAETMIRQAGRNLIIELRGQIKAIFNRLIVSEVDSVLSGDELASILTSVIKEFIQKEGNESNMEILLAKDKQDDVRNKLLAELKKELEKGVEIKGTDELKSGFIISFNKDSSSYDFSDQALAECLARFMNEKLEIFLIEAAKESKE